MKSIQGKNIWLLGASTGIGRALALELDRQGANLLLSARSADKLEALNSELGQRHQVCSLDVANAQQLSACVEELKKKCPSSTAPFFSPPCMSPAPSTA